MSHMGARTEVPWERYRHTPLSENQTWTAGMKAQRASHLTTGTALFGTIILAGQKIKQSAIWNIILNWAEILWLQYCKKLPNYFKA